MFVEKPVSIRPVEEVAELSRRLDVHHVQNGVVIAVGYMLRYAAAVGPLEKAQKVPCTFSSNIVHFSLCHCTCFAA